MVYGPREIEPLLKTWLPKGLDLIIIVGGDGTLQGTVSLLATEHAEQVPPPILMLGGGRTNYTAAHLGTDSRPETIIEKALTQPSEFDLAEQYCIRISQAGHPDTFGFFIGGALVDHVIRDCHHYRASGRGKLRQGRYSTIIRVSQLGVLGLLRRVGYRSPTMHIRAEKLGEMKGRVRLLVVTTLDKHQVTVHPYLPRGEGALKLTAITRDAKGFWFQLIGLLRGREQTILTPTNGYFSGAADDFSVTGLAGICVDGQEYDLKPDLETRISTGPAYRFVSS